MELREYLFRKDLKVSTFAKKIGYHAVHVRAVIKGRTPPGRHLKTLIEFATEGAVKASEWPPLRKNLVKDVAHEKGEAASAD